MKNITVTVDDETYRRARVRAAEQDTSVSALVRQFLENIVADGSEFERLKAQEAKARASIKAFSASDRLSREELHERRR